MLVGGFAGLVWFAFGRDPHWASRDGRRFICRAQLVEHSGRSDGRWREVRGAVADGGAVTIAARGLAGRDLAGTWRLDSVTPDESGKRVAVLLRSERLLVLRIPADSPSARLFAELLEK